MRIVVTGATGNVGTSVVEALERDARVDEVVAVARRPPSGPGWSDAVRFTAADVATDPLEPVFEGAAAVIHLAWLFQPTHHPTTTWRANAVGSSRVFDAAVAARVPAIVHASSVGAYAPGHGRVVDESWPTHSTPTAAYGREKAYVERVLDAVEARHPEVRVVRMRPGFMFKRVSGAEQRRIFAGPFVPRGLVRPGRLPVLPLPAGLRFQALHTADAARAFVAAATGDVRGAFNIAADPVIDGDVLAGLLDTRHVAVPRRAARAAVAAAWHLRLVPAEPALIDLVLSLPLLDTTRARRELGWKPAVPGDEALREALAGMADGDGGGTAPLAPDTWGGRVGELATGVGGRP